MMPGTREGTAGRYDVSHPLRMVDPMLLGWRCPVCGSSGRVPCRTCHAELSAAGRVPSIDGVDWCAALLSYRGVGRELVARAKYRNQRAALAWLGRGMAELVGARAIDVVTWAPANRRHVRRRGFDHGALLAKVVATCLGLPVERLLARGDEAPLTGRTAEERRRGLTLSATRRYLGGQAVLIVDDVVTTGATMSAAALQLRRRGAERVYGVAAAYTPAPSSRAEIVINLPPRPR